MEAAKQPEPEVRKLRWSTLEIDSEWSGIPAIGPYVVEVDASAVHAAEDQTGLDVTAVLEETRREDGHGGDDTRLLVGLSSKKLQLGLAKETDVGAVGKAAGTAAVDVWSYVVDFDAFLVTNNGGSGTGIGSEHDAILVLQSNNGGTCLS